MTKDAEYITWYSIGLIRVRWLFVSIFPALRDAVLRHRLDPSHSSGQVGIHRIVVVIKRLAAERGFLLGFVFVLLSTLDLILVLGIVANGMQVAPVGFMVAPTHSIHL